MDRSYEEITISDLRYLRELAWNVLRGFITRNPKYNSLEELLIAITLCQGAALHYYNKTNGIKDFDVWFFFKDDGKTRFPPRWIYQVDSRLETFGRYPDDPEEYIGRRVDFLGRTICGHCERSALCDRKSSDPVHCLRGYLQKKATRSAYHLSQKAVVGLWPEDILGKIIWP